MRKATSSTADSVAIPTVTDADNKVKYPLRGKFITVANESAVYGLDFSFSEGAAVTLAYAEVSVWATGDVNAGWNIPPQSSFTCIVPDAATHVNFVQPSGATASTIAIYCSEKLVNG
jgi:hypothetical protein